MTTDAFPVLCDLDGVIWLAHEPIPGSAQAVQRLRDAGHRVVFVTNNSFSTMAEHDQALHRCGIDPMGDVITSSMAAATLVTPGMRAMAVGGAGIVEALERRGVEVVDDTVHTDVDVVVVGLHRHMSYDGLANAARAVRRGARLLGTNDDATFPTPQGPVPGGGAMLAALQVASGQRGLIAGKPHAPMATAVGDHVGRGDATPPWWPHMVMVGDRPSTDGLFAQTLGCRFALVRTGVTEPGADPGVAVDFDTVDLAALVDRLV